MATRLGNRTTLLSGFVIGVLGTAALAVGFDHNAGLLIAVPGLVISGIGQGITWTAMWIAAATGVAPEQQGVANGMASTALNLGNAVGLAVLIAIANAGLDDQTGEGLRVAIADGGRIAVLLAAAGMVLGMLVTFAFLPRRTSPAKPPLEHEEATVPAQ